MIVELSPQAEVGGPRNWLFAAPQPLQFAPGGCGSGPGLNFSRPLGGLRAGSPPSPPPRSIRPIVRRLLRSPRLWVRVPSNLLRTGRSRGSRLDVNNSLKLGEDLG